MKCGLGAFGIGGRHFHADRFPKKGEPNTDSKVG